MHSLHFSFIQLLFLTAKNPIAMVERSSKMTGSSNIMTTTTAAAAASSASSSSIVQKHGIPVGVVILCKKDIHPFRSVIRNALGIEKVVYRGVDPLPGLHNSDKKQVHVPVEVAAAIVDGNVYLTDFLSSSGAEFIPGVRKKRKRMEPTKKDDAATTAKFTFVELFAGVGGFRLGLEKIGGSCVLASERDERACQIYRRHFGSDVDLLVEGDMLDIVSEDFPSDGFDILTAGFPCQPFSTRGERRGLEDDGHRGQLYQELVRILMEQRPPYFLFENVVGLITMEGGSASHWTGEHIFKTGKVMDRILKAFRDCGYKVEWKVVNSGDFVPQYRERVYFVGSLLELDCSDMNWSSIIPDEKPPILREFLEKDYASSSAVVECELSLAQWQKVQKIHGENGEPATISARLKVEDYAPTLISSYRCPSGSTTRFVMEEADGTKRHGDPLRPRFLTPREFSRVMGFPNNFDVSSPQNNEIGHIYQGLGNAVVPPVIEAIGREMLRLMEEVKEKKNTNHTNYKRART